MGLVDPTRRVDVELVGRVLATGCLIAGIWAWCTRRNMLDAAIEIDQRFGLKERVSSTFALSEADLQTEVGKALVADASRRVARLDVNEKFQVRTRWISFLPIAPAAIALLLAVFVPDAISKPTPVANAQSLEIKKRIQNSTDELKKKWAEQRKQAEQKDLKSAELFLKLEKGVGDLNKLDDVDKKKALVKLKDLEEEIKKRRDEVGDMNKLQNQLNQLKNLKPGPANDMAKAMKQGDFSKAASELSNLQDKLKNGEMSDKDRKALAEQLQQMSDKLQQTVEAHEAAKQEMKKQIEQAEKAGDNAKAGELQQKLDQLNAQNKQMKQLAKMAEKMSQASKSAQQGSAEQAAGEMGELAADLEQLKSDLEELGMLDEALDQLADAKDAMSCEMCNGMGCPNCSGLGTGMGKIPGQGLGEGQGVGDRPEAETDKQFYDSQVRGDVGKGKAVVTGFASGKNVAGDVLEDVKGAFESARRESSDPLTNVRLPKEHRDHAREYFESFTGDQ